ncbi:MAG: chitobiase/beta-hexosaminidase C-terminal domain-containing protein [Prevotella sp.]|nr:chitobiase/beta-hexosaminidase C-terminal domain-containing protein [Prevotella sp.]
MIKNLRIYVTVLLLAVFSGMWGQDVTDILDQAFTGISSASYASWSGKKSNSTAVYAGQSAGSYGSIQLNTTNSNSGIVTTATGGKVKSVTVTFNTNTTSGRVVSVYGKNTQYKDPISLYSGSSDGTQLGTATYTPGKETVTIPVTGDYAFVGIRAKSGALYLDKVEIVWSTAAVAAPSVTIPSNPFSGSAQVSIAGDGGATFYYTTDGTDPTTASTPYAGPFALDHSATVKAIAVVDGAVSSITSASFARTEHAGTADDPFNIADAYTVIDAGLTSQNFHVKGFITDITAVNTQSGNAAYTISDKGLLSDTQLTVYSGKYLGQAAFTSADQLGVGAEVVVLGALANYNDTYEFSANNYLISYTPSAKNNVTLSFSATADSTMFGETFTEPALTIDPSGVEAVSSAISYSSSDQNVATVDAATGKVTVLKTGSTTIKAVFPGDDTYNPASANYALTVSLSPDSKGGFNNPYTVAELINGDAAGMTDIYVTGYIVGSYGASAPLTGANAEATNIALADDATEGDGSKTIPVQLSAGTLRNQVNAKDNAGMAGVRVLVKGDGQSYYSVNGIKNTDEGYIVTSVNQSQYATLYFGNANLVVPEGLAASTMTLASDKLVESQTYKAGDLLPKASPVVLNGAQGEYKFKIETGTVTATADAANLLGGTDVGTLLEADDNSYFYWLSLNANGDAGSAGFYWGAAGGAAFNNAAHKAYLKLAKSAGAKPAYLFNETTDILPVIHKTQIDPKAPMYNLAGQRVDKSCRGVVLQNGKKFVVR